jgi:hypothetical protein
MSLPELLRCNRSELVEETDFGGRRVLSLSSTVVIGRVGASVAHCALINGRTDTLAATPVSKYYPHKPNAFISWVRPKNS